MLKLEALEVNTHVTGIEPSGPVKILHVNSPKDVSAEKCGWDITSVTPAGTTRHIEVKGRMSRDELLDRISIDPNVCFGKPCIRGHRIWVTARRWRVTSAFAGASCRRHCKG